MFPGLKYYRSISLESNAKYNKIYHCKKLTIFEIMKMKFILLSILLVFIFTSSCNKQNETEWNYCTGCTNSTWAGEYEGTGVYYTINNPEETYEVAVIVTINDLPNNQLKIVVSSPNKFYASFTGKKDNNEYYFDLAGTEKSIHLNLYEKTPDYKLTGVAKTFTYRNDTLVVEKSVSFEAFK